MEEARRPRRRTQNGAGPRRVQTPLAAREAPSVRFVSSPWNRGASRCIGTDGWRRLWDATTPNPLRQRRGLEFLGTGDRGWRPDGLTPGYCLKPFQGFEGGLGKGRGSLELMTGVVGAWECGDETSPPPKSLMLRVGAGTSRPRKFWVARGGRGDETSPPPKSLRVWMGAGTSRPRKFWVARGGHGDETPPPPTPSASGGGWSFGGGGPGVAAWRPYPRLLSETLSGF